ncbi:3'(2'),5'-bisphosphate nucleotidase CysQ family protein [Methylobacterium gnaphalii]|uniref:3'(2'),5'-bisphosphate nucleotidase CysQ n=1 Tax=Methylobacterium gnaphalii TaxID=1010610 RepID=A0A512JFP8_9HYPH|nr:3'(2'),5'-bisphosphate nucleotidase CysQ [Methylobacterium gnaphalii]GEP08776.1 3'(2'),5'-bisphosphate nucleotidase CysQ [Methylobacterium gnaphalii]GLS47542.1 3'(2'),5'-bisphosphate nucleotidase CysQ [Methylobacterium gnaphalii]
MGSESRPATPPRLIAPVSDASRDAVAASLAEIACGAGEILRRYHGTDCPHQLKPDGSPASLADMRSEEFIVAALTRLWPEIPVIAEEMSCEAKPAELFFLVDPLDGTRDFLAGVPEYSVNICLIWNDRPIAAALAAPGLGRVWYAGSRAVEAPVREGRLGEPHPISARTPPREGLVALVSRCHGDAETDACLDSLPIVLRRVTSSALKFGLLAAGEADVYVRCVPTMEWDTAAGDHILAAAGGRVVGPDGTRLTYGHRGRFYRNGPFAAFGECEEAPSVALPSQCAPSYRDRRRASDVTSAESPAQP